MTTFCKGARVELTLEVVSSDDRGNGHGGLVIATIVGDDSGERFHFYPGQISAGKRLPRTIGVGDRVRIARWLGVFRVHAIADESAFLLPDECRPSMKASRIVPLSDLTLAEET